MINYEKFFNNETEMKDFVLLCENNYKAQIIDIAEKISSDKNIKFIMLSGPSCSGKTTTADILFKELEKNGKQAEVVSIDDFYRNRIKDESKPDFESAAAIDLEYFGKCVAELTGGREAQLPVFDFNTETRKGYRPHRLAENEIIVFEGIQAMYPEILSHIPNEKRKTIYISVSEDVMAYGHYFSGRDIRFARRLVRDYKFRSSSPARTLGLWSAVVANEEKSIIPEGKKADFVINSLMLYEINVMKSCVFDINYDLSNENERTAFEELKKKYGNVPDMPSYFIPEDSVFREFIGK